MSRRINIVLPEKTIGVLDRVTTKGNRSRFIDRAVLHYVGTHGKQALREQLAAGYRVNAERDLAMAAEWFPLGNRRGKRPRHPVSHRARLRPRRLDVSQERRHLPRRVRSGARP